MAPAKGTPINGVAVRAIREAKGWPSGRFATSCQISTGYLSNIERGEKPRASAEVVRRIADVLGVPLAAITSSHWRDEAAS